MKSDIDIKELWRKQAVPFADCSGLFKEVNHFKRKKVLELIVLNAVLWMTICFVAFVWIYFKPQLLVTKIGITRPISDGFKKNNVNYWVFRDLCSIILHS